MFDEVSFDTELDRNGKPILTGEDDVETVKAIVVDYMKREFKSYQDSVSGDAFAIYDDIVCEMDCIIEGLKKALGKEDESRIRNRRFARRR